MGTNNVKKGFATKGVFPHQWAFTLLIPARNVFLSPAKLISRLDLKPAMRVLEIGPGPGYFSYPVARYLTSGTLVLADIQAEMLDKARKRMVKRGLTNVEYFQCNGQTLTFPDCHFDRIFMVTVLGEVENKDQYMSEFHRVLKPGGILSISEQAGDPDKMTIEGTTKLAKKHGFVRHQLFGKENNFTLNFIKS